MVSRTTGSTSSRAIRKAALDSLVGKLASGQLYTLGRLFHDHGLLLERPIAQALARRATVFARNVSTLGEGDLEGLHVSSREAAGQALRHDDLLVGILRRKAATGPSRAHTLAQLSDMVPPREKRAFRETLEARRSNVRWPAGVGALHGLNAFLVFLMDDVVGQADVNARPSHNGVHLPDFARAFGDAFDQLRRERRVNLVPLSSLRQALPSLARGSFDQELYALRRANQFVLETHESRHGPAKPEELAAAIEEGGRRFVYVSRRDHD